MMLAAAMVLAPNVRFAPIATEFMRRSEPTLCATSGLMHRSKPPDQLSRGKPSVPRRAARLEARISLNHLIGPHQHRRRKRDAQFIRYLPVHRQLEASRLRDR